MLRSAIGVVVVATAFVAAQQEAHPNCLQAQEDLDTLNGTIIEQTAVIQARQNELDELWEKLNNQSESIKHFRILLSDWTTQAPDCTTTVTTTTTTTSTTSSSFTEFTTSYEMSNAKCPTTNNGLQNCLQGAPPGICCTITKDSGETIKCSAESTCTNDGGTYEDPVETTAEPTTIATVAETTLAIVETTGLVMTNTECVTTNAGVANCEESEPPGVCCSEEQGGETVVRCIPKQQCSGTHPPVDTTSPEPTTTTTTTRAPGDTTVTVSTAPIPTTAATFSTIAVTTGEWENSNEACLTEDGVTNCDEAVPPGVCCTRLQGEDFVTRCTPLDQCKSGGGTYPGSDATTMSIASTTASLTTMQDEARTTVVATSGPPPTTTVFVQSNEQCLSEFEGVANCTSTNPPQVCCTTFQPTESTKCSDPVQCEQQGGIYPMEVITTIAVTDGPETTTALVTEATTMAMTTGEYVQSNTACMTSMEGIKDCINSQPPGVCCVMESAVRCTPEEQCEFQGGEYPEIVTTTTNPTTMGVVETTLNQQTTAQALVTTTVIATTTAAAEDATTGPLASTAAWTQGNTKCLTSDGGWQNCFESEPPGVCCSVSQGPNVMVRCMPEQQCGMQGGSYPAVDAAPTTMLPMPTTVDDATTMGMETTVHEVTTAAALVTTVAEVETTLPHVNENDNCLTTDGRGIVDCFNSEPPGVCCTIQQGDQYQTRCMPAQMCSLQNGEYPALATEMTTMGAMNANTTSALVPQ